MKTEVSLPRIGFVGIGQMGRWMAGQLLSQGYVVEVYDQNREACLPLLEEGAKLSPSVSALAGGSDIVIMMLPSSGVVETVTEGSGGLFASLRRGAFILDMSSSYVLSTRRLALEAHARGLSYLDAPVSGGVKGAKQATLTIMVGGTKEDFEATLPILHCLGKTVNHVGDVGAGHALKALNNYLSAASLWATTEAMVLAKSLGLDLSLALDTINQSSGQSFSTHYKFPNFVLPRTFNSGFGLELLLKDVRMVTAMAKDQHIPVALAGLVEQLYETANLSLDEEKPDHTEVVKFLEGVTRRQLS